MGDSGAKPVDHRNITSELSQHRYQHAWVGLAQVCPQLVGFDIDRHDIRVSEHVTRP
jgi:hypothetical protein